MKKTKLIMRLIATTVLFGMIALGIVWGLWFGFEIMLEMVHRGHYWYGIGYAISGLCLGALTTSFMFKDDVNSLGN